MLTYKLIEVDKEKYVYEYYPEGDENAPGKVALYKNTHLNNSIIKESGKDFGRRYACRAIKGIDISKDKGTVAWY